MSENIENAETKPKAKPKARKPITVQQFAAKHNVGERKVRRVTRSLDMGVGRGSRYTLKAADQNKILKVLKS